MWPISGSAFMISMTRAGRTVLGTMETVFHVFLSLSYEYFSDCSPLTSIEYFNIFEPDDTKGENCVAVTLTNRFDGGFADHSCEERNAFVCQM